MKERIFIQKAKDHVSLEEFVRRTFSDAKTGAIEVQYTPIVTRIIIHTVTPGLIVGVGGERIRSTVEKLKKELNLKNPQIDVQRINNPYMDPYIVAQNLRKSIERGINYKRLGDFYLTKIMAAGAVGCEIVFSGKLSGQRSRVERYTAGYIKKCGMPSEEDVLEGFVVANPRLGNIGITVKIMIRHREISMTKIENILAAKERKENIEADPKKISGTEGKKEDGKGVKKEKNVGDTGVKKEVMENRGGKKTKSEDVTDKTRASPDDKSG